MNRSEGLIISKWTGITVGVIAIFGALTRGIGAIYAEDQRLGAVEATTAMMPCLLWDLQILKAEARSRNPVRYDSLVENQIKISGPRPVIQRKE